jgi:hypothetical protein
LVRTILIGSALSIGLAGCGADGGSTHPDPVDPTPDPAEAIPEQTYALDLSNSSNTCGKPDPGTFRFYVATLNAGKSVAGIISRPAPATVSGDRLTLSATAPAGDVTVTVAVDWVFAPARHTFQGTTTLHAVSTSTGASCTFTYASTGTHDLSIDAPPTTTEDPTPPASTLLAPRLRLALMQVVPAHTTHITCFQEASAPEAEVYFTLVSFERQPGSMTWVGEAGGAGLNGGYSTTDNGAGWLMMGGFVAWHDGQQWQYSGAFNNANGSWILSPRGDWFDTSVEEWLNGQWAPIGSFKRRVAAGQAIAFAPRGVEIWAHTQYVWGPVAGHAQASVNDEYWTRLPTCDR